MSYPRHSFGGGILLLCRDVVGVFYSPSQQGCIGLSKDDTFTKDISPKANLFEQPEFELVYYDVVSSAR